LLSREGALDPAASKSALETRLRELGHADYDDFMANALTAELTCPTRADRHPPDFSVHKASAILTSLRKVLAEKHDLLRTFDEIREIPMNLHITASRIEAYGGPVATLAENYRLMAADIIRHLEVVVGDGKSSAGLGEVMLAGVNHALFLLGAAQIQGETVDQCRAASDDLPFDRLAEISVLENMATRYSRAAEEALCEVGRNSKSLMVTCEELKRQLLGLDSIRVLCRVESGRRQLNRSSLQSIIDQLDAYHGDIDKRLDRIVDLASGIGSAADAMGRSMNVLR
jgi:aerotaxis receptor